MLPYFTVTFAPPAVVTNLLPSPLYLKVGEPRRRFSHDHLKRKRRTGNIDDPKTPLLAFLSSNPPHLYIYTQSQRASCQGLPWH